MTLPLLHSVLKTLVTMSTNLPLNNSNDVEHRVTQAWQSRTDSIGENQKTEEITSMGESVDLSEAEKKTIEDFIERLLTTQSKRETYVLLNHKLSSLSRESREKFIAGLIQELKNADSPEVEALLKEKFNPAYSMYIASGMMVAQLNEHSLENFGQVISEDDDDDDDESNEI